MSAYRKTIIRHNLTYVNFFCQEIINMILSHVVLLTDGVKLINIYSSVNSKFEFFDLYRWGAVICTVAGVE